MAGGDQQRTANPRLPGTLLFQRVFAAAEFCLLQTQTPFVLLYLSMCTLKPPHNNSPGRQSSYQFPLEAAGGVILSNINSPGTEMMCMFERGFECLYVCVYVFFPFILNVMFVGCISRESHRRKVTQDLFSSHLPSAVHAFIFLARRIQPFLSLVGRYVQFCVTM